MAKTMSEAQKAYETKRAKKAGMTLDKWLAAKDRDAAEEARARARAAEPPPAERKKGLLTRLIDRAHKPLKS